MRAERWHQILQLTEVDAKRADCYALTTVGYMGNNVLPARAGEALRVVLLCAPRCDAGKRTLIGSIVAERMLDVIALGAIFVVVVYGVLSAPSVLPTRPAAARGAASACCSCWPPRSPSGCCARHHVFERVARLAASAGRCAARAARAARALVLLAGTFVLWALEARGVPGRGARRSSWTSA